MQSFANILKEGISLVPWHSLASQASNCSKVPDSLFGLLEQNPEPRKRAYWGIDNVVVVQGGLYEGAFFVTPFLIEMIRVGAAGAVEIYDLLFEIANGSSEL